MLGVDQATRSGWSIHVGLRPIASGSLNVWNWAARRDVLREALALSGPQPLIFAFEDHSQAILRSYKCTSQVLALGGALWLWLDTCNRLGQLECMRLGITSRDWRHRVLGVSERLGRDALKAQAIVWACAHTRKSTMDADEADAVAVCAHAAVAWPRLLAQGQSMGNASATLLPIRPRARARASGRTIRG